MKTPKPDAWNFVHRNFAAQWFDGLPIGNGDIGALMIPDHRQTIFQLSKIDVWDERCDDGTGQRRSFRAFKDFAELRALVEAGHWDQIDERWWAAYRKWKGKFCLIPAGSLVLNTLRFEHEVEVLQFARHLDMQHGLARNPYTTRVREQEAEAIASVAHGVIAIHVRCSMNPRKGNPFRAMTFGMDVSLKITPSDPHAKVETGMGHNSVWQRVRGYHEVDYTIATLIEGKGVTIVADKKNQRLTVTAKDKADFVIYVAISSKNEALARVKRAASVGHPRLRSENDRWWKQFWSASRVEIPETTLLRQYHFGLYLLGASSRKGFQMPGLQGLWPSRPIGSGWNEYTNDLNIEMCYWPVYTSNHLELAWPYYDTVRRWLPETRRFTREYYKCNGVQFSCCSSPEGIMPPGYLPTCHWAAHAAFIAQNFWTHYLYTRDENFLRDVAYPLFRECALFYLDFLKKDKRGYYEIWPSSNPEAGEGSYEAWGRNPSVDISLIRMLLDVVVESARLLGCDKSLASDCQERIDQLPPYPTRNGALIEMESKKFLYSQRHTGMLTPIYPCSDLTNRTVAEKSLDAYVAKGKELWGCHSVPWVACVAARLGRGEEARDYLREMIECYTIPQGGFNLNYDYHRTGKGIAGPPVFCNESNSGFSAALLEMLLQSHDGTIHLFPAVPKAWRDVDFQNLRAQGAFVVSAARRNGKVVGARIFSERGGKIRLENPWLQTPKILSRATQISVRVEKKILVWESRPRSIYKLAI